MTFQSEMTPSERADYGFARVRDVAFDAITTLWRRRKQEGMKQSDVAAAIGKGESWVSRTLRGPGNWTLRTMGELTEALNGEIEIKVHAMEDPPEAPRNYNAYAGYEAKPPVGTESAQATIGAQMIGKVPASGIGEPVPA